MFKSWTETYIEFPRSGFFRRPNLLQIFSLLLCQPNEESCNEWVVQWVWWRDLLPLLLIETAHGAVPVAPFLASRETQIVFPQLSNAALVNKSGNGKFVHFASYD